MSHTPPYLSLEYYDLHSLSSSQNYVESSQTCILIEEIMLHLSQKQWQHTALRLSELMKKQRESVPKIQKMAQAMVNSWTSNIQQMFLLQYFDYVLISFMKFDNRQIYTKLVFKIFHRMISELKNMFVKPYEEEQQQYNISQKWQIVLQILRTYNFQCLKMGLNQYNWFICWVIMCFRLNECTLNKQYSSKCQQFEPIISTLINLKSCKIPPQFYNLTFHTQMLIIRIFISEIKQFMSTNNKIVKVSQSYPSINNCSLLMKIIQSQYINETYHQLFEEDWKSQKLKICNKLDCLILLIAIMETSLPKCQNYNKILEYSTYIAVLFSQFDSEQKYKKQDAKIKENQEVKEESKQNSSNSGQCKQNNKSMIQELKKRGNISPILFYCGQLIGMIIYRNCDWMVQFCRKEAKESQKSSNKSIKKLLKLLKKSVEGVMQNIEGLEHEDVIYKRLVLGFCGLLRVNKMQTVIEETIQELSGPIIRIIQSLHGWEDEQQQNQIKQSFSLEKYNALSYNISQLKWNEQYHNKHRMKQFENVEEIEQLLKSMWGLKDHNLPIFQSFMNHFDEKQSLLWMVELEKYGEEQEEYKNSFDD